MTHTVRLIPAAVATLVLVAAGSGASSDTGSALPSRLDAYFGEQVTLSARQRARLDSGSPVATMLDGDASKDVGVFGAVWIAAPRDRYVVLMKDIDTFEKGSRFRLTTRIGAHPTPADFASLRLPDPDVADLRSCRVGDCAVKLGADAIERFRAVNRDARDATHAAANAVMREVVLEYVTGYLEGGNDRLPVYRDQEEPTSVAREFRDIVDSMPVLTSAMPEVHRYLLGYPHVTLPEATSFLYWQDVRFGLKPTLRVSHLTIRHRDSETLVLSRMLYASHYFWTGLELRVLVPDPARGPGFWFAVINRSRSDGLSGFAGLFARRRVRSEVPAGMRGMLEFTRRTLEKAETATGQAGVR